MNKQTKVLLSILGVVVVGALVFASTNSGMFQGRAGRDVGSTRSTRPATLSGVVLKLNASGEVLKGSVADLLSAVSKGYKVTATKNADMATKPLSFECYYFSFNPLNEFECTSNEFHSIYYYQNNAKLTYVVDGIITSFKDMSFSVVPTSILVTINGDDGSISPVKGADALLSTPMLRVTYVSTYGAGESFYCDAGSLSTDKDYLCTSSYLIDRTYIFKYNYETKKIAISSEYSNGNAIFSDSGDGRTFYFSK